VTISAPYTDRLISYTAARVSCIGLCTAPGTTLIHLHRPEEWKVALRGVAAKAEEEGAGYEIIKKSYQNPARIER